MIKPEHESSESHRSVPRRSSGFPKRFIGVCAIILLDRSVRLPSSCNNNSRFCAVKRNPERWHSPAALFCEMNSHPHRKILNRRLSRAVGRHLCHRCIRAHRRNINNRGIFRLQKVFSNTCDARNAPVKLLENTLENPVSSISKNDGLCSSSSYVSLAVIASAWFPRLR